MDEKTLYFVFIGVTVHGATSWRVPGQPKMDTFNMALKVSSLACDKCAPLAAEALWQVACIDVIPKAV